MAVIDFYRDEDIEEPRRYICAECDEPVGERYYEVAGMIFCEACMNDYHLHYTED